MDRHRVVVITNVITVAIRDTVIIVIAAGNRSHAGPSQHWLGPNWARCGDCYASWCDLRGRNAPLVCSCNNYVAAQRRDWRHIVVVTDYGGAVGQQVVGRQIATRMVGRVRGSNNCIVDLLRRAQTRHTFVQSTSNTAMSVACRMQSSCTPRVSQLCSSCVTAMETVFFRSVKLKQQLRVNWQGKFYHYKPHTNRRLEECEFYLQFE